MAFHDVNECYGNSFDPNMERTNNKDDSSCADASRSTSGGCSCSKQSEAELMQMDIGEFEDEYVYYEDQYKMEATSMSIPGYPHSLDTTLEGSTTHQLSSNLNGFRQDMPSASAVPPALLHRTSSIMCSDSYYDDTDPCYHVEADNETEMGNSKDVAVCSTLQIAKDILDVLIARKKRRLQGTLYTTSANGTSPDFIGSNLLRCDSARGDDSVAALVTPDNVASRRMVDRSIFFDRPKGLHYPSEELDYDECRQRLDFRDGLSQDDDSLNEGFESVHLRARSEENETMMSDVDSHNFGRGNLRRTLNHSWCSSRIFPAYTNACEVSYHSVHLEHTTISTSNTTDDGEQGYERVRQPELSRENNMGDNSKWFAGTDTCSNRYFVTGSCPARKQSPAAIRAAYRCTVGGSSKPKKTTLLRSFMHQRLQAPVMSAEFPMRWVTLLEEWENNEMDLYAKPGFRSQWSVANQQRYSKRFRGINMLRKKAAAASIDIRTMAAKLDSERGKETCSNHLISLEKGDVTIQRRRRFVIKKKQTGARKQTTKHQLVTK